MQESEPHPSFPIADNVIRNTWASSDHTQAETELQTPMNWRSSRQRKTSR